MLSHNTKNIHNNCETCKERLSNFELLRILAMLLVLLVHCNFFSLGHPTQEEAVNILIPTFTRCVFESLCICCVNVFVLISGWFGINPSIKSLGNFLFQCVFFIVGIYVVMLIMGKEALSIYGIARCLLFDKNWFIISYLLLYILSPVLNAFIKEASSRIYMVVLVTFFIVCIWMADDGYTAVCLWLFYDFIYRFVSARPLYTSISLQMGCFA